MKMVTIGNCGEGLEFMEGYPHIAKLQYDNWKEGLEKRIEEVEEELGELVINFQTATENNKIVLASQELQLKEEKSTIERLIRRKYSVRARLNNSVDHAKECIGEVVSDCCPEVVKSVEMGVSMCIDIFRPRI